MRKLDFGNLIAETVVELREREKKEKNARVRLRIQMLRLLKSRASVSINEFLHSVKTSQFTFDKST